jgi:LuxR family maltose regulon positive regulatory protein
VLIALGREQPAASHLEDALILLARLREAAERAGWTGKLIEILVLQAMALQAQDEEVDALAVLDEALSIAEPEGYVRTFVDEGTPMTRLLKQAAERGMAPRYVSHLQAATVKEAVAKHRTTAPTLVDPLSDREIEVLRLLSTEMSSSEIASELVVSVNTVRTHIKHIYSKLDVHSRYEAVERATDLNLL